MTLLFLIPLFLKGKEIPKPHFIETTSNLVDCIRPVARLELNANNVRARLSTNANFFSDDQYVFPKPLSGQPQVSAIYTAGLWMGGVDRARNIKVSASSYQAQGFDYFAGPLDLNGLTDTETCRNWDKLFSVNGDVVKKHYNDLQAANNAGIPYNCDDIPDEIKFWPSQGNPYWFAKFGWELPFQHLAPFWDDNTDGIYDPCAGDFPIVDLEGCQPKNGLEALSRIPTQHIFYIFNDNGGPQTLTRSGGTLMEIAVSSFAFGTNDEFNNMTFHQYKLMNKGNELLIDFHFGLYVDPDLGCYRDDFLGYDKNREMAYVYNQDELDGINNSTSCGSVNTYGNSIPMIGFDFHKNLAIGKRFKRNADNSIVRDNDGNVILENPDNNNSNIDTIIEAKIASFIHIENGSIGFPPPATTDPLRGREEGFYNYLRGFWSDGTPLTYGGTGYNPGSTDSVSFAFPDDPSNVSGWSMCNVPQMLDGDRKFMLSSEGFTVFPGMVTSALLGIIGVLDIKLPCPDLSPLRFADDKAQNFYDNCFQIVNSTSDYIKDSSPFKNTYLFPNPTLAANKILNIKNLPSNCIIKIIGTNGQILHQYNSEDSFLYGPQQDVSSFNIESNSFSSGLFIVQILENKTQKVKSYKWIVL